MAQGHTFETDAQGNLVGVPTNLKVDSAGNVFDGAGNYVGRSGEVYVDMDGNAVNAAGQIVGFATAGVRAPVTGVPVANVGGAGVVGSAKPVAAEVLNQADFYRDADGGLLKAPTNLTVDDQGMVRDSFGNIVGREGEVFVDAHGNAVNASGQIVGAATAHLDSIINPAYSESTMMSDTYQDGTEFAGRPFAPHATDGLLPDAVTDAGYEAVPEAGYATADAGYVPVADAYAPADAGVGDVRYGDSAYDAGYVNPGLAAERYDSLHDANAYPDPRNKYLDGPDGVAQNRYGDGVYGDGSTFASRAFGQNLDTEMLDRDTPDRPLVQFGRNDMGAAGEPVGYEEGAPARANRWQHMAMHRVTGASVPTDLTVDAAGNVHDAAGNYVGKAGEVVAEPDGTVLNAQRQVVGRTITNY